MSEPTLFSLFGRSSRRKSPRRALPSSNVPACVEKLESRNMLTAPTGVVIIAPSPPEGLPAGGAVLTINGQNFGTSGAPATVQFVNQSTSASTPGTSVNITIPQIQLTVQQPALPLGTYDVIVTNSDGSSTPSSTATYQVVSVVPPTVSLVSPFGSAGTTLTVHGSSFTSATQVNFVNRTTHASTAGAGLQVSSDSQLTVAAPSLPAGNYDVTVTNSAGTSTINAATDSFVSVAAAQVAATHFTTTSKPVVSTLTGANLDVVSTLDFASSGYLFVETSNGLATVQYASKTDTSFVNCTVLSGDPLGVGAADTTGILNSTYAAVYQAPNTKPDLKTFEYDISNKTKLTSGNQDPITFAMYWSSVGDPSNPSDPPTFYYWDSTNADGSGGKFSPVSKLGLGGVLPTYTIADSGGISKLMLPYIPVNSARVILGAGTPPHLVVTANGITTPDPTSTSSIYDFFEMTMDASGTDNSVPNGLRLLPTLNINTSQVDQFGMPITLTGINNVNGVNQSTSVGDTLSTNVARDAIFSEYRTLHPVGSDPYAELLQTSTDPAQPLRILNPGKMTIGRSDPLGYVFDAAIQKLFETGSANLTLSSTVSNHTYTFTSTRTTKSATGSDSSSHTYNVIQFTDSADGITLYVYEPFFSTNAPTSSSLSPVSYAGKPPAMQWLTSSGETAGQMVFGNDGVFTDAKLQPGLSATEQTILADLENQIVAALNRGVANKYSTTADWQNSANYYPAGETSNLYAQFLHQQQINNIPIFIDGKAYAIAYDDQGNQNPSLVLLNQSNVTATLGPWQTPVAPDNNADFLAAVYMSVLDRALDAAGRTHWLSVLSGGASRLQVSLDIANSREALSDVIAGFYTTLLHRTGDNQEIGAFVNLLQAGWTQAQIKSAFYGSAEYFQVRAGGTNLGFVNALFQDELGRAPESQTLAALLQYLAMGNSRASAAAFLTGSAEANQFVVQNLYVAYLNRVADAAGLAYWSNLLQQTGQVSIIEAGILGSQEYYVKP